MSLAEVEQARVHLTFPKDSVFLDSQQPAKASVLVKIEARHAARAAERAGDQSSGGQRGGGSFARRCLRARYEWQPAGPPEAAAAPDGPEPSEAALDYRHQIETDLLAKINSTLEPLLGAEKFRASVSVECDFSGGEQSEEIFDPAHSVMSTSQRTEDSSGGATASGVPGTPSPSLARRRGPAAVRRGFRELPKTSPTRPAAP